MLADRVRMGSDSKIPFIPILYNKGSHADKWRPFVVSGTVDMLKQPSYLYTKNTVAGSFEVDWISTEKINLRGYTKLVVDFENDKTFTRRTLTLNITSYQGDYYVRVHPRISPPTAWLDQFYLLLSNTPDGGSPLANVVTSTYASGTNARYDTLTFKIHKIWLE